MAGESPQDGEPLTHKPSRAYRVGRIGTTTRNTIMGLSAETATDWVKGCISEKDLRRVAAAIEKRIGELVAKAAAKAAKK